MRKHFTLLVAALMLASLILVACGGSATEPATDAVEETAAEAEAVVEETVDEAEAVVDEAEAVVDEAEAVVEETVDEAEAVVEEVPTEEPVEAAAGEPVVVKWFVGLGTGGSADQIPVQEQVVEDFNASQDEIILQIDIVQNEAAVDTLATAMASGDAPDIVGPVGVAGSNAFTGSWLDLQPLVDATGYDLSQFPQASVDFYRTDEGLVGLPFGQFPSFIFFNRELFDEAGLPYPPQEFGAPYIDADGNELPWNIETFTELARQLTVDANGNDSTMDGFDADAIQQFGFIHQWGGDARAAGTFFGPGNFVDADGNAVIPENWAAEYAWIQDGVFGDQPFYPSAAYEASELLATPNAFASGNVAMANTHLWFTCCLADAADFEWDIAAVPANDFTGGPIAKLHADTFRILDSTENPEATFKVLTYLVGEGALDLLSVYGGMPARPEETAAFFAGLDETYPFGINWDVAIQALDYPDNPNHESNMPNFNKANDRIGNFTSLMYTEPMDLEAELASLQADLQVIFDEVK